MAYSTDVETEAQRHAECFIVHFSLILMEGGGGDDSLCSTFSDCPWLWAKSQRQDLSSGCWNRCVLPHL